MTAGTGQARDCVDAPGQPCRLIAHRFGGAFCRRCDRTVSRFCVTREAQGHRPLVEHDHDAGA